MTLSETALFSCFTVLAFAGLVIGVKYALKRRGVIGFLLTVRFPHTLLLPSFWFFSAVPMCLHYLRKYLLGNWWPGQQWDSYKYWKNVPRFDRSIIFNCHIRERLLDTQTSLCEFLRDNFRRFSSEQERWQPSMFHLSTLCNLGCCSRTVRRRSHGELYNSVGEFLGTRLARILFFRFGWMGYTLLDKSSSFFGQYKEISLCTVVFDVGDSGALDFCRLFWNPVVELWYSLLIHGACIMV